MAHDGWASNRGVRIHYLEGGEAVPALVPVVFVPGMLGAAEEHRAEMVALAPRRCLAISLRGRGRSDAPDTGYGFEDHIGDIDAVVHAAELENCCLMGYSRSVPYAIAWAARHPGRLAGLILGDYPPHYPAVPAAWADRVLPVFSDRVAPKVMMALQRESAEVAVLDQLAEITCPVLVLRGGRPDARLSAGDAAVYCRHLPQAEVVVFEDAGHELWTPDAGRYHATLRTFLEGLDGAAPRHL